MTDPNEPFFIGGVAPLPAGYARSDVQSSVDNIAVYDHESQITPVPFSGKLKKHSYIPWGIDNQLPYELMRLIDKDEVMSQNKFFNVLTCYGAGLRYVDLASGAPSTSPEVTRFMLQNSMPSFFLEQCTDMKVFYWTIAVLVLNNKGDKIVQLRHKETCYCRFGKPNKNGKISHIFYGNWRLQTPSDEEVEAIPLLDEKDPLGDLEVRMGRAVGRDGKPQKAVADRKFAVLCRFPTPASPYYPEPYYASIFRSDWYEIKQKIARAKLAKLKNHASIKYHCEVHKNFWKDLCEAENIRDAAKQVERVKKERDNINNFIMGVENSGKVLFSNYSIDVNGKENQQIRINRIDTTKEGGDWSDDIAEATNMLLYGDSIHPNLVGATPGKNQSNNSGSDKRELFTLKQSLETAFHDIMMIVHWVVIFYNGWEKEVRPDVPLILLTTLDENTDAKLVSPNNPTDNEPDND